MPPRPRGRGRGQGRWRQTARGGKDAGESLLGRALLQGPLMHFKKAPSYLQDNPFIRTGYRVDLTWKECVLSVFQLHNESVNIWTHGLGCLWFLYMALLGSQLSSEKMAPSRVVWWPMRTYHWGAVFCLGASAYCHSALSVSRSVCRAVCLLDYVGVATMILTSFFPAVYYIFMCRPALLTFYLGSVSLLSFIVVCSSSRPWFLENGAAPIRAMLFGSLGITGALPLAHAVIYHWNHPGVWTSLWTELIMGACYLSGVTAYAMKWPEVWWPGKFDLFGSSHQLFHLGVFFGAYFHLKASYEIFASRFTAMSTASVRRVSARDRRACITEKRVEHFLSQVLPKKFESLSH